MKKFWLFLKGAAMGAANVIPGVSGGTIAFITGIYEPFINSLKSFDGQAVKLLFSFQFRKFSEHINLPFLIALFLGIAFSLFTLGKLLNYLFLNYPVYVWSFFFGLIFISIISVGRSVKTWKTSSYIAFILGAGIAVYLAFLTPATEDTAIWYLVLCGIVAMASMILPGLSGSFVLILMGNYQLIMLQAVPQLELSILLPVGIGAILGFLLLSRLIAYLLDNYHDNTIGLLTGFIAGSLLIIWPWKNEILLKNPETGLEIIKNGKNVVQGYEWYLPSLTIETGLACMAILAGIALVLTIEKLSAVK